jgi:AcrR family transcriptional regulator
MSMSISYEETGRTSQKNRTREALVDAARQLLAEGATPTVEQAAAAASIGRATAYRYFPNRHALLTAALPALTNPSLLGAMPPADPRARLETVVDAIARQAVEHETELRTMLRLSLEPDAAQRADLPFRTGRRIAWVAEALAPLRGRLPEPELDRLVYAIAAAVGIDSLVWLTDIAGLARDEAVESMRWSARALLDAALSPGADTTS